MTQERGSASVNSLVQFERDTAPTGAAPRPAKPGPGAGWGPKRLLLVLLALAGAGALLTVIAGAGIATLAVTSMKGSDAYRTSVAFAKSHPTVIAELGEPIRESMIPMGEVTRNGGFGDARLSISLTGTRAKGQAHVVAHRDGVKWRIDSAKFETEGRVFQLLATSEATQGEDP